MQVLCMLLQLMVVHMLNFAIVTGKSSLWLNTASGSLNHSDIEKQTNKTPSNKQNKTKKNLGGCEMLPESDRERERIWSKCNN